MHGPHGQGYLVKTGPSLGGRSKDEWCNEAPSGHDSCLDVQSNGHIRSRWGLRLTQWDTFAWCRYHNASADNDFLHVAVRMTCRPCPSTAPNRGAYSHPWDTSRVPVRGRLPSQRPRVPGTPSEYETYPPCWSAEQGVKTLSVGRISDPDQPKYRRRATPGRIYTLLFLSDYGA